MGDIQEFTWSGLGHLFIYQSVHLFNFRICGFCALICTKKWPSLYETLLMHSFIMGIPGQISICVMFCRISVLILGLRPTNERRRYFVTTSHWLGVSLESTLEYDVFSPLVILIESCGHLQILGIVWELCIPEALFSVQAVMEWFITNRWCILNLLRIV